MRITKQGKLKFKVTCPVCGEKRDGKKPQFKPCARCKREHEEKERAKGYKELFGVLSGGKTAQECPTENDLEQGNMIARGENGD